MFNGSWLESLIVARAYSTVNQWSWWIYILTPTKLLKITHPLTRCAWTRAHFICLWISTVAWLLFNAWPAAELPKFGWFLRKTLEKLWMFAFSPKLLVKIQTLPRTLDIQEFAANLWSTLTPDLENIGKRQRRRIHDIDLGLQNLTRRVRLLTFSWAMLGWPTSYFTN